MQSGIKGSFFTLALACQDSPIELFMLLVAPLGLGQGSKTELQPKVFLIKYRAQTSQKCREVSQELIFHASGAMPRLANRVIYAFGRTSWSRSGF